MKQLLVELLEPRIWADGTVRQPTALNRKAANTLIEVVKLWEIDKAARIKAESIAVLDDETAISIYNQAMNHEYTTNCT